MGLCLRPWLTMKHPSQVKHGQTHNRVLLPGPPPGWRRQHDSSHLLTKRTCHRPAMGPVLHHPPHRESVVSFLTACIHSDKLKKDGMCLLHLS